MLEFSDKGNINWLLKTREMASSYYMESEEGSRKRKVQEANEEIVKRSEAQNLISSSFDQKVIKHIFHVESVKRVLKYLKILCK